jgi:hypothetical protein
MSIDPSTSGTLDFKQASKVTFVGSSSNTVIDTVTGSFGIGVDVNGPSSNLHVVGNTRLEGDINMLHTSNNAAIKLNSNVVTEFPRSKKLIKYPRVALTSASYNAYEGGYKVTVSGFVNSTNYPWKAFNGIDFEVGMLLSGLNYDTNGNANTSGTTASRLSPSDSTPYGEWLKLELPNKIKLDKYVFTSRDDATHWTQSVEAGQVWGSNNDSDWVHLHTFTNSGFTGGSQSAYFDVQTDNYYKYYAFIVTKTFAAGSDYYLCVPELKYYGTPEYDPDAHGTDVTIKSVANVPNTDWLEVYYDAKDLADGAVTSIDDLTPNGTNDGTATNVTVSDGAFVFNGTSSLLEKTSLSIPGGDNPFTFSFWLKNDDFDSTQYILRLGDNQTMYQNVNIYKTSSNQIVFTTWLLDFPINYTFTSNRWNHISLMYPGGGWEQSNLIVYVDGKRFNFGANRSSGGTGGNVMTLATSLTLRLGGFSSGNMHFNGKIANFRLFNRALTSDEIWQLYAYQKEYFGHGDLSMTLKAGRLGIGTSEPRAALDVRGDIHAIGSVNPVIGIWKQTIDSSTVTTTILTNVGSCMSTKTPDGPGSATGFSGSAGIFIAPYDGIYQFQAFLVGQVGSSNCLLVFNANGPSVVNGTWNDKNLIAHYDEVFDLRGSRTDAEEPFTFATLLNMSKGDYVDIQNYNTIYLGNDTVNCSAYLIHRFN